jgi:hypothetical protein
MATEMKCIDRWVGRTSLAGEYLLVEVEPSPVHLAG